MDGQQRCGESQTNPLAARPQIDNVSRGSIRQLALSQIRVKHFCSANLGICGDKLAASQLTPFDFIVRWGRVQVEVSTQVPDLLVEANVHLDEPLKYIAARDSFSFFYEL